ncbi:MAG: hypothetical protein M0C28_23870 [Candidatus Moduliflexus flocculans]|nr:hypothetical protein [Candidatus Moduliflexus flocculans]
MAVSREMYLRRHDAGQARPLRVRGLRRPWRASPWPAACHLAFPPIVTVQRRDPAQCTTTTTCLSRGRPAGHRFAAPRPRSGYACDITRHRARGRPLQRPAEGRSTRSVLDGQLNRPSP